VLVTKALSAADEAGAEVLCLGGGVAANSRLREVFLDACEASGRKGYVPSLAMCTDNAAMVASAGWWRLHRDGPTGLDAGADPSLRLG
jgi:N6-L-threonylcarbamoyladenine synthase